MSGKRCQLHIGSGRVLAKLGMRQEGVLQESVRKEKAFEDAVPMA
jgi:RimJ/RimL family protein N-acetyltransferase